MSDGKHVQRLRQHLEIDARMRRRMSSVYLTDLRDMLDEYDELRARLARHVAALELRLEIDRERDSEMGG
jgi:hypothetical protein